MRRRINITLLISRMYSNWFLKKLDYNCLIFCIYYFVIIFVVLFYRLWSIKSLIKTLLQKRYEYKRAKIHAKN